MPFLLLTIMFILINGFYSDLLKTVSADPVAGWTIANSTQFPVGPVNDERWKDFAIIRHSSYQRFENVASLSFSINCKVPVNLQFFANDKERLDYFSISCFNETQSWVNFSVIVLRDIYYLKNNHLIRVYSNLVPSQLVVRTSRNVDWKLQKYELYWASEDSDTPMTKSLTRGKWTVDVYSFLCEKCTLKVLYGKEVSVIKPYNNKTHLWEQQWQNKTLLINISNSTKISFMRGVTENNTDVFKFWAIDVRLKLIDFDNETGSNTSKLVTSWQYVLIWFVVFVVSNSPL